MTSRATDTLTPCPLYSSLSSNCWPLFEQFILPGVVATKTRSFTKPNLLTRSLEVPMGKASWAHVQRGAWKPPPFTFKSTLTCWAFHQSGQGFSNVQVARVKRTGSNNLSHL